METEKIAELARTVAWLPKAQREFFDGMVAEQSAMAAKAERIAGLRKLSDEEAVQFAIKEASDVFAPGELPERLLTALRDAGFVRLTGPLPNHARENRWEVGIRNIVHHLHGPRHEFEIYDIVDEVRELAEARGRNAKVDLPEAITRVRETINEIEFMVRKGIPISNAPSLKHWLLRGLDALTGENHSGCATSLPQPTKKLT